MKREAWPPEWEQDPPKCDVCGEQHWAHEKCATAAPESCRHGDVRFFSDEGGAIACMTCGRLFGHLRGDDTFVSHNSVQARD